MNIKISYTEEEGDMRKRLSYLLVVAVFVSMLSLSGCGGGGGTTVSGRFWLGICQSEYGDAASVFYHQA